MMPSQRILIVTGLPRSGTSLVMQMLAAGGVPVVTDRQRKADASNARGYYEDERVKRLHQDAAWLGKHTGEAVKIVSPLVPFLPRTYAYDVLFLLRDVDEILSSQQAMLHNDFKEDTVPRQEMKSQLRSSLQESWNWLSTNPTSRELIVFHGELMANPRRSSLLIAAFLKRELDVDAMAKQVDPALWRQRKASPAGASREGTDGRGSF